MVVVVIVVVVVVVAVVLAVVMVVVNLLEKSRRNFLIGIFAQKCYKSKGSVL